MKIRINNTEIFYEKAGSGPPLILLHGNGENGKIFDKALPLLSERYTVYTPDTRGHGRSAAVTEYHYDDMVEDLRCFIETLGLSRPACYGFSDGGIICLLAASAYPELLGPIVVSGANLNPSGLKNGWGVLFGAIYRLSRDPKMKMLFSEPDITEEMLGRITVPVSVLAGSRDLIKEEQTRAIASGIKKSRLRILPHQGHASYIVHKSRIGELIIEELEALEKMN